MFAYCFLGVCRSGCGRISIQDEHINDDIDQLHSGGKHIDGVGIWCWLEASHILHTCGLS